MTADIQSYRNAAITTFAQLKTNYGWAGNFWRLGHSFDTIIDYFEVVDATEAALFAGEYALPAFKKFEGHWYDDYGWWGLAALRAAQRPNLFGQHIGAFDGVARRCWNFMRTGDTGDMKVICKDVVKMAGAPKVWAQSQAGSEKSRFEELKPRFPGGVWNSDWNWSNGDKDAPCYCVPIYEENKFWANDSLGGFQNTVTNGLYLALAARINKILNAYADAQTEYDFLQKWFDYKAPKGSLLAPQGRTGDVYVRERVSEYDDGSRVYAYRDDCAWTGDQGVMLSALVDYMGLVSDETLKSKIREICKRVIWGTKRYLGGAGGVLREWRNPYDIGPDGKERAPGNDFWDYSTGSGVYMRFLTHVYRTDPELKAVIEDRDVTDDDVKQQPLIAANADSIDLFPKNLGTEELVVVLTNNLAKLIAAMVMLKR